MMQLVMDDFNNDDELLELVTSNLDILIDEFGIKELIQSSFSSTKHRIRRT